MTGLLDIPQLAISVLRQYMRERAENDQPVTWYADGHRHYAEPRPDKAEGRWLVSWNRTEVYNTKAYVLRAIEYADTFELVP